MHNYFYNFTKYVSLLYSDKLSDNFMHPAFIVVFYLIHSQINIDYNYDSTIYLLNLDWLAASPTLAS